MLLLNPTHYGAGGTVTGLDSSVSRLDEVRKQEAVSYLVSVDRPLPTTDARFRREVTYTSHETPPLRDLRAMAMQLRMPISKLDRILGSAWVFLNKQKYDVGLALHDHKNKMIVLDYSVEKDG